MDQKIYQLSAPSKTFLMGEYAVLKGGAGLLLNTEPRFELRLSRRQDFLTQQVYHIHQQSPAGVLLRDLEMFFCAWKIEFIDPHKNKGGFGASSAQFLLLYTFFQWAMQNTKCVQKELEIDLSNWNADQIFLKSSELADEIEMAIQKNNQLNQIKNPEVDSQKLLEIYRTYAWEGQGLAPSGMDLISQNTGGVAFVKADGTSKVFSWPFTNLDFVLIHTGKKQTTHSHLASLQDHSFEELMGITEQTYATLVEQEEEEFLKKIQKFQKLLIEKHLVSPYTQNIMMYLDERDEVLATKGCGALGADVILVLLMKDLSHEFISWLKETQSEWGLDSKLEVIATSENLSKGIQFEIMEDHDTLLDAFLKGVGVEMEGEVLP